MGQVPETLTKHRQWVAWQYRDRGSGGKREKIPISPKTGKNGSVSNPETWGTFKQANDRCEKDARVIALVSKLAALADQAIDEVRTMSYLLHQPLLDEVGFVCAAEWFIQGFAKRFQITRHSDLAVVRERLPMNIEVALFRVLQESLNLHRLSGASEVSISSSASRSCHS